MCNIFIYSLCEKSEWDSFAQFLLNFDQLFHFACAHSPCFQSHPALQPMSMLLRQRLLHLTPTLARCRPAWCPLTSCPVPPYWSPATPVSLYQLLLLLLHRNSWGRTDWRWETHTFTHTDAGINNNKYDRISNTHHRSHRREDLHNYFFTFMSVTD